MPFRACQVITQNIDKNRIIECQEFQERIYFFSCSTKSTNEEKPFQECNTQLLNVRDECRLILPTVNIVTLCGTSATTFYAIMNDENMISHIRRRCQAMQD